ncbi:MAG: hypothetical protein Q4P13_08360 [Psychrobacter sp.]|nr:hypothetical protein [Psychrobacter sp.]
MHYRRATVKDIADIEALQRLYHIDSIDESDKASGFVTTLFTPEQLTQLITGDKDNANHESTNDKVIIVAVDGSDDTKDAQIVGYAMNASWDYWSQWPFFRHMIADLPNVSFLGQPCTVHNSYQYGPVCIHKDYRGNRPDGSVLAHLFEHSRQHMGRYYPILLTFINHNNPRSYQAHVLKLGLQVIKDFTYNGNDYYELGYDTRQVVCTD